MELSSQERETFLETLWSYYAAHARTDLPWRLTANPYRIMVSELMLQQTQVPRVIPKYHEFLKQFPDAESLAKAELGDVLRTWQGLGYNRRAKYLWEAAKQISIAPILISTSVDELVKLPGIGKNTAGAILAYAFNRPVAFVETNVRTVYIHHFFADRSDVHDKEILELVEQTLDRENPREFYWALMDYGSHLKATVGNASKASKHYAKQSKFHGSRRQIRGQVLRELGEGNKTLELLQATIADERLDSVLADLVAEGMVRLRAGTYGL